MYVKIVGEYVRDERSEKEYNLVYQEKLLLSQWAESLGLHGKLRTNPNWENPIVLLKIRYI